MLDALWGGQAVVTMENGRVWAHSRVGDASARRRCQPYQGLANAPNTLWKTTAPLEPGGVLTMARMNGAWAGFSGGANRAAARSNKG